MRSTPSAPPTSTVWPELESHAASIHAVLKAWDEKGESKCTSEAFRRAVQALGALDRLAEVPEKETLGKVFKELTAGKESLEFHRLVYEPPAPEPEDEIDPDDCFGELHNSCGMCGKLPETGATYSRCQRCKKIRYCSRQCQLKAWRAGHKESCGSRLPRPSILAKGSVALSSTALREFGAAEFSLAQAALARMTSGALEPATAEASIREIHENGGIEGLVAVLALHPDEKQLRIQARLGPTPRRVHARRGRHAFTYQARAGRHIAARVSPPSHYPIAHRFTVTLHRYTAGLHALFGGVPHEQGRRAHRVARRWHRRHRGRLRGRDEDKGPLAAEDGGHGARQARHSKQPLLRRGRGAPAHF